MKAELNSVADPADAVAAAKLERRIHDMLFTDRVEAHEEEEAAAHA